MKNIINILYILFLFVFVIFSYLFTDPNLIYLKNIYTGFAFNNRSVTTVLYGFLIIIFFIFYLLFLIFTKKSKLTLENIKILVIITTAVLLLSYPAMLSHDIFNYTTTAKVLFYYHENPYLVMPIEFVNESFLLYTHAANKFALYGPSWILFTGIPFLLGFGDYIITLLNFKILITFSYFGTIFLLWKLIQDLYGEKQSLLPVTFFALNPLVIIETLISSHNDILMMFLATLSYYLLIKRKIFISIIIISLSVLIKYATLFLLPVFLFALYKTLKKEKINWDKIYYFSAISMFIIFLLSAFREEIYPWYAIWFLTFTSILIKNRFIFYIAIAFSFGLLLRYIPFMLFGTYFGTTPLIKSLMTFIPPIILIFFYQYFYKIKMLNK